jgi:uncharacterized repeat protein (TIGR03943 family)
MNHTIHRVVGVGRVVVILSWVAFLAFAWYTTNYAPSGKPGRLAVINPSYRWLSLASAAALIFVGAALLPARRDEHAHHHERAGYCARPDNGCDREDDEGNHDHEETGLAASCCQEAASPGELVFQALVLAPIVLSLCTTGSGLSGASLGRRGIHEIRLPERTEIRSATPTAPPNAKAGEIQPPLSMANLHEYLLMGAPAQLVGRQADLIGQYFVDDRCGKNQFIVTRIVVTCCLADAEVIGLRAQSPKPFQPGAHEPAVRMTKLGAWIEVSGKLKILNDRFGNPALFIDAAAVSEVPPPDNILLYPRQRGAPW